MQSAPGFFVLLGLGQELDAIFPFLLFESAMPVEFLCYLLRHFQLAVFHEVPRRRIHRVYFEVEPECDVANAATEPVEAESPPAINDLDIPPLQGGQNLVPRDCPKLVFPPFFL